jgi:predicted transposase YdaD
MTMLAERVESWFKQAEQRGRLEGRNEGLLEGRNDGLLEGEANVLARLLNRRFGPLPDWALARLHAADAAQLETWADAVLDATSLAAVVGPLNCD